MNSDSIRNLRTGFQPKTISGGNTTTYSYNFERNLTGIDYPSTSNDDSHQYDGDGVRMRSKLNGASDWTNFITCPVTGNLLCEYTLISSTFTIKSVNTWGIGLISTNRESTKRYFHFDGNGSTVALTQTDGTVTDTYVYSAFGVTESSSGASVNPFRFMGGSGAYDDAARGSAAQSNYIGSVYYFPVIGISLQSGGEPIGGIGGGLASSFIGGISAGLPKRQDPCSNLLIGKTAELPAGLLKCLRQIQVGNESLDFVRQVRECFRKHGKPGGSGTLRAVCSYIGCIFAARTAGALRKNDMPLNPCEPKNDDFSQECCYLKYLSNLCECAEKAGSDIGISACIQAAREKYNKCMLDAEITGGP